jgi:hypothetical protein
VSAPDAACLLDEVNIAGERLRDVFSMLQPSIEQQLQLMVRVRQLWGLPATDTRVTLFLWDSQVRAWNLRQLWN